jgi:hypothetical protein
MSKQQRRERTNTAAAAEAAVVQLEQKIKRHRDRAAELVAARKSSSYAAHVLFDVEQSKVLSDIIDETSKHDIEGRALLDALDEAKRRLEQARQDEAKAADKAAAQELLKELRRFREIARELDTAFAAIALHGGALYETLTTIHRLSNANFPTGAQLDSLGTRCVLTALAATPFRRNFETIPPLSRRSFSSLIETWCSTIQSRLGEQQTNEHEAA